MGHLAIPLRPLRRIGGCQALCLGFGRAHLPASSFSRNKLVPNPPRRLSLSRPPLPSLPLLIVISSCRWEEESDINGKKTKHSKSICNRHRPYLRLRCAPLAFFYCARIEPVFLREGKRLFFNVERQDRKKRGDHRQLHLIATAFLVGPPRRRCRLPRAAAFTRSM